jgi:hypothetical protein
MNGSISLKSEVGKGSIFQIILYDALIAKDVSAKNQSHLSEGKRVFASNNIEKIVKVHLDEEGIKNLKPLLEEMEADLYSEWKKLSDISSINEIEEFAYKIKYLGDKYNYAPFKRYSDNLQAKALLFDMNSLLVLLKSYPELLEDLRSNYAS